MAIPSVGEDIGAESSPEGKEHKKLAIFYTCIWL